MPPAAIRALTYVVVIAYRSFVPDEDVTLIGEGVMPMTGCIVVFAPMATDVVGPANAFAMLNRAIIRAIRHARMQLK